MKRADKQVAKFKKIAAEVKSGIERPGFNCFPTRQDLMKKQRKRMLQVDGVQDEESPDGPEEVAKEEKSIGTPRRREYKFLSKELVKTMSADSAVEKDESDSTVAESGKESKDEKNQEWKTVVKRKQHKSSKEKDDHKDAAKKIKQGNS